MALVVKDRVQETSTTTGTGTLTLSGAATGYQSFSSAIGNGNTTYYAISNGTDWEVGVGTVGSGTLARDTVLESSNAGSLVNFSAGVKTVFCTYPAERSVNTQDIGVSIQAYDADTAKYDDATANFVGTLQNGGSNVLVDTDIGLTVEAYDSTILKSASIGVTVQGYDADTAKYDDTTANFTGTLQKSGSNVLIASNIGSTVQAYDADTAKYDDTTANFIGTLQNGGSNVVVDTDIGSTVQAYDADTTKNDVSNTFTANQIISVTDNTNAALRVTQAGNGDALLVEDEANPDSTPFVVKADGKVGIGTSSPANALEVSSSETFEKLNSSTSGYSVFYQATNPQGSFYAGKDRDGSAGLFGSAGEYVIAGTGNYPMNFWTNTVKRMTISESGGLSFGSSGTAYGTAGQVLTSNGNAAPTWGSAVTIASTAEAQAGTNNTNVITPLRMREGFNASGSAPVYACRAWVSFNGTGTVAIRGSGNVSSITDNGTGDYTVNFTTAMSDANYSAVASCQSGASTTTQIISMFNSAPWSGFVAPTTSAFRVAISQPANGNRYDSDYVLAQVFR